MRCAIQITLPYPEKEKNIQIQPIFRGNNIGQLGKILPFKRYTYVLIEGSSGLVNRVEER